MIKSLIFKFILTFLLVFCYACAKKEQISIFDSNMVVRNTSESENILNEIKKDKSECKKNKEEILDTLNSQKNK